MDSIYLDIFTHEWYFWFLLGSKHQKEGYAICNSHILTNQNADADTPYWTSPTGCIASKNTLNILFYVIIVHHTAYTNTTQNTDGHEMWRKNEMHGTL